MGGRGGSGGRGMNLSTGNSSKESKETRVDALSELQPKTGMRITKVAEQAFNETYYQARKYVKTWDDESAQTVSIRTDFGERGYVSLQTLRGVQAKLNTAYHSLDIDRRLGVSTEEELRKRRLALNAVQRGLNWTYVHHRKYWKGEF